MKQALCVLLALSVAILFSGCGNANAIAEADTDTALSLAPSPLSEPLNNAPNEAPENTDTLMLTTPSPTPTPLIPTPSPSPTLPPYTVEEMDAEGGYVTKSGVNLRSGPHTEYEVITVLDALTPITVTGKSEDWYQVECEATEGYLSSEFVGIGPVPTPVVTPKPYTVTKMSSKSGYVNAGTVNFRKGPGRDYEVIAEAERYTKLTVTGTSGDWYRVRYNRTTGYMLKSYVRIGLCPSDYKSAGSYSAADVLLMAQICYREGARGDVEGYKAVASVILNRIKSSKYPNSVERVVFQGSGAQFSPADDENSLRLTKPSGTCVEAVSEIMASGSMLPSNIMYFRAASMGTSWSSARTYYNTYGGNCFFS